MIFFAAFLVAAVLWHLRGMRTLDFDRREHAFWRDVALDELQRRGPDVGHWL